MNKLPNGSIAVGSPGSNARNLSEIADSLLSTNHEQVLANKRENFKKAIVDAINNPPSDYLLIDMFYSEQIAELIAIKTFDEGIVN